MKNPSFKREELGWVRHFAFNWCSGGYNDVWAANKYDASILAEAWFNMKVNPASVKDITGKEKEWERSLPLWD